MGNQTAQAIAAEVGNSINLEAAIGWHLSGNFYPPLPGDYVEPLSKAIDAVWEDEPNRTIILPRMNPIPRIAVEQEDGTHTIRAIDLIDVCRAWAFIQEDEEDEEY